MKNLLVLSVFTAAACAVHAQGTVNGSNAGGFGVRPIYLETVASGNTAGTSVMVELWGGASVGSLSLLATGPIVANGLFALGTVSIPGVAAGADATIQIRAWDSAKGATYAASLQKGSSVTFTATTGGVGSPPSTPGALGNFASFAIVTVPEPATLALAGIGGLGLLALRRKSA
jgi:hypothetical protein